VQAPKEAPAELNGMRALKRDTEDLDVMFGGLGGGKPKGKKQGGGGGGKGGAAKKEAKEPTMSHSLDTHASYAMLKLKAPSIKVTTQYQPPLCSQLKDGSCSYCPPVGVTRVYVRATPTGPPKAPSGRPLFSLSFVWNRATAAT